MLQQKLLDQVLADVKLHCRRSKGYEEGGWVNLYVPHDCVSAFAMAQFPRTTDVFDRCIAVAPEGHVYGYFFEKLDVPVLSVYVDYPPRRFDALDDLTVIGDQRVLLLEDDAVSGVTLRLVVNAPLEYGPQSLGVYLGRPKETQCLERVPPEITSVYLAEDHLDPTLRESRETGFTGFFQECFHPR
ncbi:MAG: hypothetical protein HQ582_32065 [Planctomycetes bacterium]|nr:hypothetical protein [Planctomycetota bacterium]